MSITLDTATAERIREILSDVHDEAKQAGNELFATEIDTLCGALVGPPTSASTKPRIAVDITGGVIHQIIADREIDILFLDSDSEEIQRQLDDGAEDSFAPNHEGPLKAALETREPSVSERMEGLWVMREPTVEVIPNTAAYYTSYASDAQARRAFNQFVQEQYT